jgi:hypothetical protein
MLLLNSLTQQTMKFTHTLLVAVVIGYTTISSGQQCRAAPNILVLFAADLGWAA